MIAYARLNGTWSQSLAPDEARSPPHLESSGGVAQKQTLWAIVSGQTANRSSFDIRLLRQLLALTATVGTEARRVPRLIFSTTYCQPDSVLSDRFG